MKRILIRLIGLGILPFLYATSRPVVDGKVVFTRPDSLGGNRQVFRVNIDGSELTQLTFDSLSFYIQSPRWSPDGSKIAYIRGLGTHSSQVMIMNSDGSNLRGISETLFESQKPNWSPDGSKVVYEQFIESNVVPEIFYADTASEDGSLTRRLTNLNGSATNPQWSGNGRFIYFQSSSLANSMDISKGHFFSVEIGTGNIRLFTTNAIDDETDGHISPDGTQIIFSAGEYNVNHRIFKTDIHLSYIDTLTGVPQNDRPRWSNDGRKIIFIKDEDPSQWHVFYNIYIMDPYREYLTEVIDYYDEYSFGDNDPDLHIISQRIDEIELIERERQDKIKRKKRTINPSYNTPTEFALYPAHPNPFNPVTTIQFSVPELTDVNMVIYDIQGRLVETLLNEKLSPGTHIVKWDGSGVSSGVYFVLLEGSGQREIQKVVLMK